MKWILFLVAVSCVFWSKSTAQSVEHRFYLPWEEYVTEPFFQGDLLEFERRLIDKEVQLKSNKNKLELSILNAYFGRLYHHLDLPARSYDKHIKAIELAKNSDHPIALFWSHINMAEYYRWRNDGERNFQFYQEAQRFLTPNLPSMYLSYYYNRILAFHFELPQYNNNRNSSTADSAFKYCTIANDLYHLAYTYAQIGVSNRKENKLPYLKEALRLFSEIPFERGIAETYHNLAIHQMGIDPRESIQYCLEGLEICRNQWPETQFYLFENLHKAYKEVGDYENAYYAKSSACAQWSNIEGKKSKQFLINHEKEIELEKQKLALAEINLSKQELKYAVEKSKSREKWLFLVIIACILIISLTFLAYFEYKRRLNLEQAYSVEKDVLLQEVHHRVKNNLQHFASMLNIQKRYLKSNVDEELLNDLSKRVQTLSISHSMLYSDDSINSVYADEYLGRFVQQYLETYSIEENWVEMVEIKAAHIKIDFKECQALGIILSESLSNTIKHSTISLKNKVSIAIEPMSEHNLYRFSYSELNPTQPSNQPKQRSGNGVGKRMIELFIKKLNGEIIVNQGYNLQFQFYLCG